VPIANQIAVFHSESAPLRIQLDLPLVYMAFTSALGAADGQRVARDQPTGQTRRMYSESSRTSTPGLVNFRMSAAIISLDSG